jgi:hypothetical protein
VERSGGDPDSMQKEVTEDEHVRSRINSILGTAAPARLLHEAAKRVRVDTTDIAEPVRNLEMNRQDIYDAKTMVGR